MRINLIIGLLLVSSWVYAQNTTATSLFLKKNKKEMLDSISSKSGNLFNKLGHHGPAVENRWVAYRMYFDKKTAIDIYSKTQARLELEQKKWYPTKKEQLQGWGADYYKVGKTVGVGGIKLWANDQLIDLNPVSRRSAKVVSTADSSYMEMFSEGIPYKNQLADIKVRLTVFSDKREAKVEAFCTNGLSVQFATGLNYFKQLEKTIKPNYLATWGIHPEDVAAEKVKVGAAVVFNPDNMDKQLDDGRQILLISKPCHSLSTWIVSANEREKEINSYELFINEVEHIKQ